VGLHVVISLVLACITVATLLVTLGRILQRLEALEKLCEKQSATLDPDKGVIRELRDRTHKASNHDQELTARLNLLERDVSHRDALMAARVDGLERLVQIDARLSRIEAQLPHSPSHPGPGDQTPARGVPTGRPR
jgi:uncharacterized protein YoxC